MIDQVDGDSKLDSIRDDSLGVKDFHPMGAPDMYSLPRKRAKKGKLLTPKISWQN